MGRKQAGGKQKIGNHTKKQLDDKGQLFFRMVQVIKAQRSGQSSGEELAGFPLFAK